MTATRIRKYWYQPNDEQFLLYNGLMLHNSGSFCTDAHDFVTLISRSFRILHRVRNRSCFWQFSILTYDRRVHEPYVESIKSLILYSPKTRTQLWIFILRKFAKKTRSDWRQRLQFWIKINCGQAEKIMLDANLYPCRFCQPYLCYFVCVIYTCR